jgi:hypothetical protein
MRNSVRKYKRNSWNFYCKKYRGIPYVFQKIPYSVGSQNRTSVDTLSATLGNGTAQILPTQRKGREEQVTEMNYLQLLLIESEEPA